MTRPTTENPALELARFRADAERVLRAALHELGLLEIAVPTLVPCPGMEAHLRAFPVLAEDCPTARGRYLHTSPEFAIKAMLADLGVDVFTLVRSYRDEPISRWHHPEFTMLEWYRNGAPWTRLMDDCEFLVRRLVSALAPEESAVVAKVSAPFRRLTVDDAFRTHVGVRADADAASIIAAARERGVDMGDDWDWDTAFTVAYAELVEAALDDVPTFLCAFPARAAALARLSPSDPSVAERFELYLPSPGGGVELANAFGELVDAEAQRARFVADTAARERAGLPAYPMPERMLAGLDRLGPTSGIALGWERLLTWLAERILGRSTGVADWLVGEPAATPD